MKWDVCLMPLNKWDKKRIRWLFLSGVIMDQVPKDKMAPSVNCWLKIRFRIQFSSNLEALKQLGGLDAIGSPLTDNIYHAGWAWAGDTPFKHTKLIASHFGGTRNPMVISWPKGIKPDKTPRSQFHHVNDITPTIYDILGITPPKVVNGFDQMPFDGVSMKYTFDNASAAPVAKTQFFDNNGSRGVYQDGWYACTFGPLYPWIPAQQGLDKWDSKADVWELYNLNEDFSQANNLAAQEPETA